MQWRISTNTHLGTPAHPTKFTSLVLLAALTLFGPRAGLAETSADPGAGADVAQPKEQPAPGAGGAAVQPDARSTYDRIWGLATLYKDDQNPVIEELDFTGRVQVDYFHIESDQGHNSFFEVRRLRLGGDSWWADRHVQLKGTVDTRLRSYQKDPAFYGRITEAFVNVHVDDALNIRGGKFEPHFGYDRQFSDIQQKFFERSFFDDNVFNKTGNDYVSGASALGKIGNWGYQIAVLSNNVGKEFGNFNGGESYLSELSYDFSKRLGWDKALWTVDFMHMHDNDHSNVFNTMHNAVATYFDAQKDRLGFVTQFGYGDGKGTKGDIYEVMLMPSYYIIPKSLELILRYQLGLGSEDNAITTLNRQESTVGKFTGDTYNAVYLGLNYYLYGQKLKLMLAEQFADLSGGGTGPTVGYTGATTLVGLRMYW
jgi:hypothetical protein